MPEALKDSFYAAKLQMFVLSIKRKRALINKLNNNEPKVDPCGTPLTIS